MSVAVLKKGSKGSMVRTLKASLNEVLRLHPQLETKNNLFDDLTANAVIKFKVAHGVTPIVAEVDSKTWGAIGKVLGLRSWFFSEPLPMGLVNVFRCQFQGPMNFRQDLFFGHYMQEYGGLSYSQREGLSLLLRNIDLDPEIRDVRWAAYMLATVKHECADTWQPIEEFGKGKGKKYGEEVEYKASDGRIFRNKYYGRGYVQLTHKENYKKLGVALHLGEELVIKPERALTPEIAYQILSYGMRNGSFTGKKLNQYITGTQCDYLNARRIIIGTDRADQIRSYAEKLEVFLRASLMSASSAAA